ncbi:MAG: 50S ribosomal protein L30, partial [Deinococcota bacterium]
MKLTLKRSLIGVRKKHRDTVKALGLRKTGDQREVHET